MHGDGSPDLGLVLADPGRVADLRADDIPALLGALEQIRAALWARMLCAPAPVARDPDGTPGDRLLTVAEVAAEVRFTPGYVYEAVRRGQLSAVRKGKYVRIRRADFRAWLDGLPAKGLDPRLAHPDSSSLHGPRTHRSAGDSSSSSRAPLASRGRGARAVARKRPTAEQEHR
jgi:excisionase family DNA binding protein